MKRYSRILLLAACSVLIAPLYGAPRLVDNSLGERLGQVFPELRNGYIDLNQNGSLDQLEDMDEAVSESRLRDDILQVQEIFDFLIVNYRYLPLSKLNAVRDALDDPRGAIPEILTINYRTTISRLISEKEAMGDDGLYLSPSARREALARMEDLISRLGVAYQKEWQRAESDFVQARRELFDLLAKGYPIPEELLPEDYTIFESALINATMPGRSDDQETTRTAIYTLGKLKSGNSVPYLMQLLDSDEYAKDAIRALGAIGTGEAQSLLLAGLESGESDRSERLERIRALGKIGGRESAGTLLAMLNDEENPPDDETELEILNALATMASVGYLDREIAALLTEKLQHKDSSVRTICVRGLSYYTDQNSALQILNTLKNDRDEDVQLAAVRSLHRVEHPSTVPTIAGLLRAGNLSPQLEEAGIRAVGMHPDGLRGVANVLAFIGSSREELRTAAKDSLRILYDKNNQTVAAALARGAATAADDLTLKETTALMAELSDPTSLNTFASLLSSPNPEVRKNVTWGLYRIGVAGNLRVQIALQKLVTSETEPLSVRINAVRSLAAAGEDHPSMKLSQTFATTARMRGEKYTVLRLYSLRGLGALGDGSEEVISVLRRVALAEKDPILREEAVNALRRLGSVSPEAEKALFELAGGDREDEIDVRLAALAALGDIQSDETGPAARRLLELDPGLPLKRLAVYALVQGNNEAAYEVLFDLLGDEDLVDFVLPFLEEGDPDILEPLIDRRLKRESDDDIRNLLEAVLTNFDQGM